MAHTEVFILNYNGARFLPECLESLLSVECGEHTFEVSVVDNGSSDNSREVVSAFPAVHFIALENNYGFSKGNNLGVWDRLKALGREGRRAEFVCFLNNDTKVESQWLLGAMKRFAADPTIGVVGSKALFYDPFVDISFSCALGSRQQSFSSVDMRTSGIFLAGSTELRNIHPDTRRSKWPGALADECGRGRLLMPEGRVLLAVKDAESPCDLILRFTNHHPTKEEVTLSMTIAGHNYLRVITPGEVCELVVTISPGDFSTLIQNAGSFVTFDWLGGDEGTFEPDQGHFDTPREVAAVCGVSMFMRADLFKRLRGFYEGYFAYFEDTDLSLRARLRGYSCWYEPTSRLRHVHCGSGGEFSPYFNFNVTHSHLLFASRWMKRRPFLRKISEVFRDSMRELSVFEGDQDLETKPNLRTLARCIKRPLRLPMNRLVRLVKARAIGRMKTEELCLRHDVVRR